MNLSQLLHYRSADVANAGFTPTKWNVTGSGYTEDGYIDKCAAMVTKEGEIIFVRAAVDINENVVRSTKIHVAE